MTSQLSDSATNALRRIELIRKYPVGLTSEKAEKRVLANLSLSDYLAVIEVLKERSKNPSESAQ
jgi:hypothetical protein